MRQNREDNYSRDFNNFKQSAKVLDLLMRELLPNTSTAKPFQNKMF